MLTTGAGGRQKERSLIASTLHRRRNAAQAIPRLPSKPPLSICPR
jgi:hypothetical protein